MEERSEVVLTSVKQLNDYLNVNADEKTIISITLGLAETSVGGEGRG